MRQFLSFQAWEHGCRESSRPGRGTALAAKIGGSRVACYFAFLLLVWLGLSMPLLAQTPVLTSRNDNARTGANTSETLLTPTNVNKNSFGHLFSFPIDYVSLAQPLYVPNVNIAGGVHNVVYVVTQADSVYAIDADNGTQLWYASMLNGGTTATGSNLPCQFGGFKQEGIVSTPVIDLNTNTMYLVAKTFLNGVVRHDIHALDITTGLDLASPVQITAQSVSNLGHVTTFNSLHQKNRPGLLLQNGTLYIGFGSNGCNDSNSGWLLSYDEASLTPLGVFNTSPDQGLTSIWQSGNGLAGDDEGNIYAETGEAANNNYDIYNGGQTYCNSVLKLASDDTLADYFTPWNVSTLNSKDFDLSSTGTLVLPDQSGPYPHELIAGGKQGWVYVLNRDNLGMYSSASDQIIQEIALEPSATGAVLFGAPAYWNNNVYFAPNGSNLRAFPILPNGLLGTQVRTKLSYNGSHSPSISANGNTNGIVWVLTGQLFAFDAVSLNLLYSSTQAANNRDKLPAIGHFVTQTVADGKVFVATQTSLEVYGLFAAVNVVSGNGQTGTVGSPLTAPIQIQASNPYTGQLTAGTTVNFSDGCKKSLPTTCGSFNPTSAVTDSNGYASTTYTLPQKAGVYTITFSGIGFSNATATATATAGTATKLVAYGGGGQTGANGFTLAKPIVVEVLDAYKNPVSGFTINFTATKGAIPNPASAVTDATGLARTYVQLPNTASAITVTGTPVTPLTPAKATFSEHSVAPVATGFSITNGNNQSSAAGSQLSATLTVKATDQFGNPFSGVSVNFSDNGAGGTFSNGNTVVTGTDGTASDSYTLPTKSGTVSVSATASGLPAQTFTETATAGPAVNIAITGGNDQSAQNGTQLPQPLVVTVTDQYGNGVSGVSVGFNDQGSGGSFSNPNPGPTASDGTATQYYTLPPVGSETVLINATAAGISNSVMFTEFGQ